MKNINNLTHEQKHLEQSSPGVEVAADNAKVLTYSAPQLTIHGQVERLTLQDENGSTT